MLRAISLVHNTCRHLNLGYYAALKLGILTTMSEGCADCEGNKETCSFGAKRSVEQIKDGNVGGEGWGTCGTYGEEQQCTLYKVLAMNVKGK